jgi:hypothetical protein
MFWSKMIYYSSGVKNSHFAIGNLIHFIIPIAFGLGALIPKERV